MKKMLLALFCGGMVMAGSNSARAMLDFKKAFEGHYGKSGSEEFKAAVKKAGCNVCHVKGSTDREKRNPYGEELAKLIEGSAKERLKKAKDEGGVEGRKAEVKKLVEELQAALPKVEAMKNGDGESYGDRLKANKLPVEVK